MAQSAEALLASSLWLLDEVTRRLYRNDLRRRFRSNVYSWLAEHRPNLDPWEMDIWYNTLLEMGLAWDQIFDRYDQFKQAERGKRPTLFVFDGYGPGPKPVEDTDVEFIENYIALLDDSDELYQIEWMDVNNHWIEIFLFEQQEKDDLHFEVYGDRSVSSFSDNEMWEVLTNMMMGEDMIEFMITERIHDHLDEQRRRAANLQYDDRQPIAA